MINSSSIKQVVFGIVELSQVINEKLTAPSMPKNASVEII